MEIIEVTPVWLKMFPNESEACSYTIYNNDNNVPMLYIEL